METWKGTTRANLTSEITPEYLWQQAREHTALLSNWRPRALAAVMAVTAVVAAVMHFATPNDAKVALISAGATWAAIVLAVLCEFLYQRAAAPAKILSTRLRDAARERAALESTLGVERAKLKEYEDSRPVLELRFSNEEPHRFEFQGAVYYRLEVFNTGQARVTNLKTLLLDIEPKPRDPSYRASYPFRVREPQHYTYSNDEVPADVGALGIALSRHTSARFEFLCWWVSAPPDSSVYITRLDTGRPRGIIRIEDGESWTMTYSVSCDLLTPITTRFSATREGHSVRVDWLGQGLPE